MTTTKHNNFIIGISGGSGSGKTTFIKEIKKQFSDNELCVLSQDDYYKPREEQITDEFGVKNFDLPTSLELDEFYFDLLKLTNGMVVEREEYTFNNELAAPKKLLFKPAPVIIVEGLFVYTDPKLFNLMDLRIIIHATDTQKIIRRIKRDRVERNYPLEDVLYRYEHHVLPSFETYILPFINKVDIVINNNKNYDLGKEMLIALIEKKLKNTPL